MTRRTELATLEIFQQNVSSCNVIFQTSELNLFKNTKKCLNKNILTNNSTDVEIVI